MLKLGEKVPFVLNFIVLFQHVTGGTFVSEKLKTNAIKLQNQEQKEQKI